MKGEEAISASLKGACGGDEAAAGSPAHFCWGGGHLKYVTHVKDDAQEQQPETKVGKWLIIDFRSILVQLGVTKGAETLLLFARWVCGKKQEELIQKVEKCSGGTLISKNISETSIKNTVTLEEE